MLGVRNSRQIWVVTGVTLVALLALCSLAGTVATAALIPLALWIIAPALYVLDQRIPAPATALPDKPFTARPPTRGPPA